MSRFPEMPPFAFHHRAEMREEERGNTLGASTRSESDLRAHGRELAVDAFQRLA